MNISDYSWKQIRAVQCPEPLRTALGLQIPGSRGAVHSAEGTSAEPIGQGGTSAAHPLAEGCVAWLLSAFPQFSERRLSGFILHSWSPRGSKLRCCTG